MYRLRVGIVTMEAVPWQLEDNYQRLETYVREAARRRAELVIAPEAILEGYVQGADPDTTQERMLAVAQTVPDGPYIIRARRLSNELGVYLIFGFLERVGEELFNTCVLCDPQGEVIAKYSKISPAWETAVTPGRELKPFDTPLGRVGFLICNDTTVLDNFSVLGAQGAEIIFIPTDGGGPWTTRRLRQRAIDNLCWIVFADTSCCAIIDPKGEVRLEKYEMESVSVQRLSLYATPRGEDRVSFMARRPDLYEPLTRSVEEKRRYDDKGCVTPFEEEERAEWRERLRELRGK